MPCAAFWIVFRQRRHEELVLVLVLGIAPGEGDGLALLLEPIGEPLGKRRPKTSAAHEHVHPAPAARSGMHGGVVHGRVLV